MTLYLLLFTNYGHLPPVGHASTILNSIRAVTSRPRKDNAPAHHPHPPTPSKATPYPSRIPTTSRKQRRLQTAAPRSRGEQQLATSAKRKRRKRMRQNQSVRTPQVVGKDAQIDEKAMVSSRRPRFFFFFFATPYHHYTAETNNPQTQTRRWVRRRRHLPMRQSLPNPPPMPPLLRRRPPPLVPQRARPVDLLHAAGVVLGATNTREIVIRTEMESMQTTRPILRAVDSLMIPVPILPRGMETDQGRMASMSMAESLGSRANLAI